MHISLSLPIKKKKKKKVYISCIWELNANIFFLFVVVIRLLLRPFLDRLISSVNPFLLCSCSATNVLIELLISAIDA